MAEQVDFADVTYNLHQALSALELKVEDALVSVKEENFKTAFTDTCDEPDNFLNLAEVSGKAAKKLDKEVTEQSVTIKDGFPESKLHITLNLLNEFETQCEQQEKLIKERKAQLEEIESKTKKTEEHRKLMEECIEDRKISGEIAELRGYTTEEINQMAAETKKLFISHRNRLMTVIKKLFPEEQDNILEILAVLSQNAFDKTGTTYLNLKDHPELQIAATYLLQLKVIATHPNRKHLVQLCIIE